MDMQQHASSQPTRNGRLFHQANSGAEVLHLHIPLAPLGRIGFLELAQRKGEETQLDAPVLSVQSTTSCHGLITARTAPPGRNKELEICTPCAGVRRGGTHGMQKTYNA